MNKTQLTQDGYAKLQSELDELQKDKRVKAVDRLQTARAMGDLSENSEYVAAKEDLEIVEERIDEIDFILKNADVIQTANDVHRVDVGVTVIVDVNGSREEFSIVGDFEADPMKKQISHTSPLGKALISKKIGDMFELEVPAGKIRYTVVDIRKK